MATLTLARSTAVFTTTYITLRPTTISDSSSIPPAPVVSGGFFALSAYTFGLADLTADGDAEDLLLDVSRDWKPEAIADLDVLEKESMGFATTRPFGLREICELPFYSCAECLKAVGLPVPGCHAFWQESVYRTYLKTYGIPKGRFLASSEAEAERIVSGRPDLKKSDFLWPRRCGKTQDNPSGEHRKPEPMALYASIMPTGLSNANGLGALSEQQVKAAKGGLADAITAREEYNGVTTVPFFATPTAAGTRYEAVYGDGRMAPQGPPEMRFLKCQANTGCKPPAPIRFNKVHHPPHEALVDPPGCCPPCQRGCCPLEPSSERLTLETVASNATQFLVMGINDSNACMRCVLNPLLNLITGRLNMKTAPEDALLAEGVRSQAMLDFVDGGVMDTQGVTAAIAAGSAKKILLMCTPQFPFKPPPKTMLDDVRAKVPIGGDPMSVDAVKATRKAVMDALGDWVDCLDPDGMPVPNESLSALFGIYPEKAADRQGGRSVPGGLTLYTTAQVLDSAWFPELLGQFKELYDAGRPLVATVSDIQVVSNPFHGTSAVNPDGTPHKIDLTVFMYNLPGEHGAYEVKADGSLGEWVQDAEYVPGSWADRVPPDVLSKAGENFPYLAVTLENFSCDTGFFIEAYRKEQVNLYGYLGDFMVHDSWDEVLGPFLEDL